MSVEAVQLRLTVVAVFEAAVTFVGAVGAVVSVDELVVTFSALLAADVLPAASLALTVKVYAVLAARPVTV
ncbi:hypothetical protein D3C71_1993420 [compost metagenome]